MTAPRASVPSEVLLPEGWIIDTASADHLAASFAFVPPEAAGVVALGGPLPAGCSYRAHAERLALDNRRPVQQASSPIRGAVLLRDGVVAEREDGAIVVDSGPLLIDTGAHAHDPWAPVAPVSPASEHAASPFPRRPTVVLLKCETDPEVDLAEWSRNLANGLIRHEIEARLAMVDVAPGLHLTHPCLPSKASIRAIRPDVIITLDRTAAEVAPDWCDNSRSTIVIELGLDPAVGIELMPWRLNDNAGRNRARIGQSVDAGALAKLVSRLCAGPQPLPPARQSTEVPVPVASPGHRASDPTSTDVAVVGTPPMGQPDRLGLFAEHASRCGAQVTRLDPDEAVGSEAKVLVLASSTAPRVATEVAEQRTRRGLRTIIDVSDRLDEVTAGVIETCGYATAASLAIHTELRRRGVQVQLLPTLLAPSRYSTILSARCLDIDGPKTLGLLAEPGAEAVPPHALRTLRQAWPDLRVVWFGDRPTLPDEIDEFADVLQGDPLAEHLAKCVATWWLPGGTSPEVVGRPRLLLESVLLGVPVLFERDRAPDVTDQAVARFAISSGGSNDPMTTLRQLLEQTSPGARRRLADRADSLYGNRAVAALTRRLLGWAQFERENL